MNFTKVFKEDYILYSNIQLDWSQVQKDLLSIKQDQSRIVSITGEDDVSSYIPDALKYIQREYLKYGYTQHNTKIWKTTNSHEKLTFDWEQDIIQQLPLDHAIATVTRQDPGQILPWHMDRFFFLKQQYPDDSRSIWRFLMFLENWKMGHILQINDSILHHWKQGDVVVWQPNTEHLAANVGLETKWTCNITGFLTI